MGSEMCIRDRHQSTEKISENEHVTKCLLLSPLGNLLRVWYPVVLVFFFFFSRSPPRLLDCLHHRSTWSVWIRGIVALTVRGVIEIRSGVYLKLYECQVFCKSLAFELRTSLECCFLLSVGGICAF